MGIKGSLDAAHVDGDMARQMRENGEDVSPGWYGIDDDYRRHIGPHASREACEAAIKEIEG